MVLTLPIGKLFWASDTALGKSPIIWQEEWRSLISAMTIVKTFSRWDKCVKLLWDYVQKERHLNEITELHFTLLRLSFRLWVWHRRPHFLNSLSYLFIVYMLFISQSEVKFLCGIIAAGLWNASYVVLAKKYVFILKMFCFLSFLRRIIKHYTQLVEKVCDIKYYIKKYAAP